MKNMDEQLLERLGIYYVHFSIGERFGYTFEEYVNEYLYNDAACTIQQLNKKAATMAVVTA